MTMAEATDIFVHDSETSFTDLGGGVKRKLLCYDPEVMMVVFQFEAGGVGALHSHPHRQITYVKSGLFDMTIAGRTERIAPGDCYRVPANAVHGIVCIEAGELVDVFTPWREDFLK